MSEEINNFRNKSKKCLYNKFGFCKYREDCRKQHFLDKCSDSECDQECDKRHPKECNRGESCKFYKKKICSYDHENRNMAKVTKVVDDELEKYFLNKFETAEKKWFEELKELKTIIENDRKAIKE